MALRLVKTLLVLLLSATSLLSSEESQPPMYRRYAHALTRTMVTILDKEFHLSCYGSGGSSSNNISCIALSVISNRRASVEEAREILVKAIERMLEVINGNEEARPYLAEYPFPPSRVELSISFRAPYGVYQDGTVSQVFQCKNDIVYYLKHPVKQLTRPSFEEPYPEALTKVQNSLRSDLEVQTHKIQPYEAELDRFLDSMASQIKKKWNVRVQGRGGDMGDGIKEFAFLFHQYKRVTLEQARRLHVGITEMLVCQINANEKLRPYLKTYPCTAEQVTVRIDFQDSPTHSFRDGSLISVSCENNKIQYHVCDVQTGGRFLMDPILLHEEPYDTALQITQDYKPSFIKRLLE